MEIWKAVVGWEGLYEVSDLGRVRSLPRIANRRKRSYGGAILAPSSTSNGYVCARLCRNSECKKHNVHRLVLIAFVGECPDGMEGCHNNGVRADNRLANLRWDTRLANSHDALTHGTRPMGSRKTQSKLTEDIVREIRASSDTGRALSARHGVALRTIQNIKNRETWRHV